MNTIVQNVRPFGELRCHHRLQVNGDSWLQGSDIVAPPELLSLATLLQDGNHHLSKILYLKPASCDCLYLLLFLIGHYLAGVKWILTLVLTPFLVIKSVRSTYCSLCNSSRERTLYNVAIGRPLLQVASLVLSLHVQSSLIKVVYSEHAERSRIKYFNKEGE